MAPPLPGHDKSSLNSGLKFSHGSQNSIQSGNQTFKNTPTSLSYIVKRRINNSNSSNSDLEPYKTHEKVVSLQDVDKIQNKSKSKNITSLSHTNRNIKSINLYNTNSTKNDLNITDNKALNNYVKTNYLKNEDSLSNIKHQGLKKTNQHSAVNNKLYHPNKPNSDVISDGHSKSLNIRNLSINSANTQNIIDQRPSYINNDSRHTSYLKNHSYCHVAQKGQECFVNGFEHPQSPISNYAKTFSDDQFMNMTENESIYNNNSTNSLVDYVYDKSDCNSYGNQLSLSKKSNRPYNNSIVYQTNLNHGNNKKHNKNHSFANNHIESDFNSNTQLSGVSNVHNILQNKTNEDANNEQYDHLEQIVENNNQYEYKEINYMPSHTIIKATVKQVLSGDTFVVYEGKDNKNERTLKLYNIYAPKLARKPTSSNNLQSKTSDEAFAWESREFLRELIVGKNITYEIKFTMDEYRIFVIAWFVDQKDQNLTAINNIVLSKGFACLKTNIAKDDDIYKNMKIYEDIAINQKIGIWQDLELHVKRNISWCVDDLKPLIKNINKSYVDAIVEQIIDGCLIRVLYIDKNTSTWNYFLVKLMGIRPSAVDYNGISLIKLYLEKNILQRNIVLYADDIWAKQYILGTLYFEDQNYSMHLLDIGFFQYDKLSFVGDDSMMENYISMMEKSKYNQKGFWDGRNDEPNIISKHAETNTYEETHMNTGILGLNIKSNNNRNSYSPLSMPDSTCSSNSLLNNINNKKVKQSLNFPQEFDAEVLEIGPGDSLIIKHPIEDTNKRIFFSSTIFTKHFDHYLKGQIINSNNRVFLIPYLYEAREYLRKNFLGKTVHFILDYIVDSRDHAPERICCTVIYNNQNIGYELIVRGLALCMRHKKDDFCKSVHYHALLEAENYAMSQKIGIHSDITDTLAIKCIDMTHMPELVKPILNQLLDLKDAHVIVESVLTSVRFRLYISKLNIIISFIMGGLMSFKCNSQQRDHNNVNPPNHANDNIFSESVRFAKRLCLHHDATVNFEFMDRGGNMIGSMLIDGQDIAILMLENGYAQVNWGFLPSGYNSERIEQLKKAEENYRIKESGAVTEDIYQKEMNIIGDSIGSSLDNCQIIGSRKNNFMPCVISDMRSNLSFSIQLSRDESIIIMISETLNSATQSPQTILDPDSITIGQYCAAQDIDNEWYRAKIVEILDDNQVVVNFLDFGNCIITSCHKLLVLPDFLKSLSPQCSQFDLSFVRIPISVQNEAFAQFRKLVTTQFLLVNHEFTLTVSESCSNTQQSTLSSNENQKKYPKQISDSINDSLIEDSCTNVINNSKNCFEVPDGTNIIQHQHQLNTLNGNSSSTNMNYIIKKYATILLTQDNVDVSSHLIRNGLLIIDRSILKPKIKNNNNNSLNKDTSLINNFEIIDSIDSSFVPLIEKYLEDEDYAKQHQNGIWAQISKQNNHQNHS